MRIWGSTLSFQSQSWILVVEIASLKNTSQRNFLTSSMTTGLLLCLSSEVSVNQQQQHLLGSPSDFTLQFIIHCRTLRNPFCNWVNTQCILCASFASGCGQSITYPNDNFLSLGSYILIYKARQLPKLLLNYMVVTSKFYVQEEKDWNEWGNLKEGVDTVFKWIDFVWLIEKHIGGNPQKGLQVIPWSLLRNLSCLCLYHDCLCPVAKGKH